MKSLMREEIVYRAVLRGELKIDRKGRVWRLKERVGDRWRGGAKTIPCRKRRAENDIGKYLQVRVMTNGVRVQALAHRLVWRHFKGRIPPGLTINHKDGKKKRNVLSNLELATHSDQMRHMIDVLKKGRVLNQYGTKNAMAKLTDAAVREIRRRRKSGERLKTIAADFGVSDRAVSKIALGQRWGFLGLSAAERAVTARG